MICFLNAIRISILQKILYIFWLGFFVCQFQPASGELLTLGADFRVTGSTSLLGNLSMNQNKMTVDSLGNTAIAGTLDSVGNFSVNTDKFTVAASTGNTVIGGTLNVLGSTTLTGYPSGVVNDLRITGSTTMLGKLSMNQNKMTVDAAGNTVVGGTLGVTGATTLNSATTLGNGSDLRVTGSTMLLGQLAVNQNKFTVSSSGNTSLAGKLDIIMGGGNLHHCFGQKSISSIGTSATSVLSITFANLAGSSGPLNRGARIRLYALASGSVTLIVIPADSVIFYTGDLIVSPGATGGAACTLIAVSQTSTSVTGNASTITASVTGTGVSATLNLAAGTAIADQASASIFYEVISDNVTSVS